MLYKGKGDTDNPNSYRGIALENNIFKIFMKVVTNHPEKETETQIPDCQFGFRRNRSTLQAVMIVIDEIESAMRGINEKPKYIAVFIDYTKAFDLKNREKLLRKVKRIIGDTHSLSILLHSLNAQLSAILLLLLLQCEIWREAESMCKFFAVFI